MKPRDPYVPLGVGGDKAADIHRWPRRTSANREMVSGLASHAMYLAIKDRAAERKQAVYRLVDDMNIGASTYDRLRNCKPIAQTTALKIVTFLGTSVRAVMGKYHQEKK